jgi:hypothetical protein
MGREKIKSVIISIEIKDRLIRDKIRRTINHRTVLTCVAAGIEALCPVIVTSPKVSGAVDIVQERIFIIKRNSKLHVDGPSLNVSFVTDLFHIHEEGSVLRQSQGGFENGQL